MLVDARKGMGQDPTIDTTLANDWASLVASAAPNVDTNQGSWWDSIFTPAPTTPVTQTNIQGSNTSNLLAAASIGTAITQDFTNIFKAIQPVPPGCTQVQTLQGNSVSCLSSSGQSATTLGIPSIGGLSSSTLLLIGAALVGLMMLKK